jgi:Raf kinase inhibitor-like YbhB/YbcL family protein
VKAFKLRSPAFGPGGEIPPKYTCDGSAVSPPLRWTEPPPGTQGFALLVADLDDAMGVSVHWVLYGVPVSVRELPEGVPRQGTVAGVGTQGLNDLGGTGYDAPCPPRGPAHRYFFRLYALDIALALPPDQTKGDLLKACSGHLLARVELIGRYKRKESSLNQPPHPCLLAGALREGRQSH